MSILLDIFHCMCYVTCFCIGHYLMPFEPIIAVCPFSMHFDAHQSLHENNAVLAQSSNATCDTLTLRMPAHNGAVACESILQVLRPVWLKHRGRFGTTMSLTKSHREPWRNQKQPGLRHAFCQYAVVAQSDCPNADSASGSTWQGCPKSAHMLLQRTTAVVDPGKGRISRESC